MVGATASVGAASATRAWLGTRNWQWLTRLRLRAITVALITLAVLGSATLKGSTAGPRHSPARGPTTAATHGWAAKTMRPRAGSPPSSHSTAASGPRKRAAHRKPETWIGCAGSEPRCTCASHAVATSRAREQSAPTAWIFLMKWLAAVPQETRRGAAGAVAVAEGAVVVVSGG